VSVASAQEAAFALAGGADIIDAKDPESGALGAVSVAQLQEIHRVVAGSCLVTAALGDATDEDAVERAALAFTTAGASFVKIGFAGIASTTRVSTLLGAAVRGATRGGAVAVAYADANRAVSLAPAAFVDVAARAGAKGVLLDTADKAGPGLRSLMHPGALETWVKQAHDAKLLVAVAGKLTADDLPFVRASGADIAGVRGAACNGGRTGQVATEKVRLLHAALSLPTHISRL